MPMSLPGFFGCDGLGFGTEIPELLSLDLSTCLGVGLDHRSYRIAE